VGNEHHRPASCAGCPLNATAKGFCLGSGDTAKAKYAIILEAPSLPEVQFSLNGKDEYAEEIKTRQRDYPELRNGSIRTGLPAVGPTGLALEAWILKRVGIRRDECFIDHTIRCLPPKGKTGSNYPTGDVKKAAELHCRQYDRIRQFRPNTVVFGLSPSGLLREITPLPLSIKDFEKVRDFTAQGRRVLTLLGGKTTAAFMRYGGNIARWRGDYHALAANWSETYKEAFVYQGKTKRSKKVIERPAELTESCSSCKRYKGKNPPKHPCLACWTKYESNNVQILV